jgi:hypothetical protein
LTYEPQRIGAQQKNFTCATEVPRSANIRFWVRGRSEPEVTHKRAWSAPTSPRADFGPITDWFAGHLVSADDKLPNFTRVSRRVTKIAIDKRARESENREHEENCARVLPASGRLCGEKAAGCGDPDPAASHADPGSHTESDAAPHCRAHRTLCGSQAGKCQHGHLQVSAHDHCDRFKDGTRHASLQENERRTMRPALEGKSCVGQNPRLDPAHHAAPNSWTKLPRFFSAICSAISWTFVLGLDFLPGELDRLPLPSI